MDLAVSSGSRKRTKRSPRKNRTGVRVGFGWILLDRVECFEVAPFQVDTEETEETEET